MKVLVFDDNQTNRSAARAQLKDHDLTVVGTYDEAQELLTPQIDREASREALKRRFGDFNPYGSNDEPKRAEYFAAEKVADEQAMTYPAFDVVLTDLLVPASSQSCRSSPLVGTEMSVGIFIGLLAAVRGRVKHVAVFTDNDHHSHPASACFDIFNNGGEQSPQSFTVENSKVILSNTRSWVRQFDPKDLSKPLEYEEAKKRWSDTIRAKDWASLLEYLLKGEQQTVKQ